MLGMESKYSRIGTTETKKEKMDTNVEEGNRARKSQEASQTK